jgi:hypothetical protein
VTRNSWIAGGAVMIALTSIAALLGRAESNADSSTLSHGKRGWRAARRYLEERGHRTSLLADPGAVPRDAVVVSAFPWQVAGEGHGLVEHVRRGGTLVLGYDLSTFKPSELALLEAIGLSWQDTGSPTLDPLQWPDAEGRDWRLMAEGVMAGAPPVVVRARGHLPAPPETARVLYRAEGGPAIFELTVGKGRVVLLPSDALSNGRLFEPGNADLLETLSRALVEPWWFDEYHHGLPMPSSGSVPPSTLAFDVAALHLVLLYALAVAALVRRFGPAWAEPPAMAGSTGTFLLGLGALHHRLGHHQAAARLLLERVQQLDRGWTPTADMLRTAHAADARRLVELSREVSRLPSRPA